ncbi:MAG: Sua5/YciO/YrdC/YwlC family protein [Burkholderiaceae bacterium]|nr:Sua5/YciO/YrdC/YwlC family protein [Burkholderiaceae bacterium]
MNARGLRHYLKTGGVFAYPTEAVFGLGCDPSNRKAVQKILRLKGRPQHKGLILVADCFNRLERFVAPLGPSQIQGMQESWGNPKKPHTWIVPAAKHCPKWLTGRHSSIAIRVSSHPLTSKLCKDTGMALVSTSANHSGHQAAKTAKQCRHVFGHQIQIMTGKTAGAKKPSTIQDLLTGKILRK